MNNNWRRFYVLSINVSKPFSWEVSRWMSSCKDFWNIPNWIRCFFVPIVEVVQLCACFLFCFTSCDSVHKFGYTNCFSKVNDKGDGIGPSIYTLRLGCNIWWLNMVSSRNIGIWTFKEGITWVTPHERIYHFIHCLVEMSKYIHSYFFFQVQVPTICIDSCPKHIMKNVFEVFIGCAP